MNNKINDNKNRLRSHKTRPFSFRIKHLRDRDLRTYSDNLHKKSRARIKNRAMRTLDIDRIERNMVTYAQKLVSRYKDLIELGQVIDMVPDEHVIIQCSIEELLIFAHHVVPTHHPASFELEEITRSLDRLIPEYIYMVIRKLFEFPVAAVQC